jgi:hypothetical protein
MEFELLGDQWYLVYYSSDWYKIMRFNAGDMFGNFKVTSFPQ